MTAIYKGITIAETTAGNFVEARIIGKLTENDYEIIIPELERRIKEYGRLRLLIELEDFQGWTAGALWEDIKFDFRHFHDIYRIALVGDSKWEKTATLFSKPFTAAELRYFDWKDLEAARRWIRN
ncbi:MAG: STAS/SEC14 domain-containing protein [Desulfobulbales bacterium]